MSTTFKTRNQMATSVGYRFLITFSSILVIVLAVILFPSLKPSSIINMPPKPKLNVQSFPRPPLLEKTPRHLQVKYQSHTIADTKDGYWALETHHPPTYYIPPTAFTLPLHPSPHTSFCEWKGRATYYHLTLPSTTETVQNKAWSYNNPTKGFEPIKGYISLYANAPWECFVDGEKVVPQEGDFYGGWVTEDIEGRVKGGAGTLGW